MDLAAACGPTSGPVCSSASTTVTRSKASPAPGSAPATDGLGAVSDPTSLARAPAPATSRRTGLAKTTAISGPRAGFRDYRQLGRPVRVRKSLGRGGRNHPRQPSHHSWARSRDPTFCVAGPGVAAEAVRSQGRSPHCTPRTAARDAGEYQGADPRPRSSPPTSTRTTEVSASHQPWWSAG